MFCYTVANNIDCVARELAMWSEISMEHPNFLCSVAQLTHKRLSPEIKHSLSRVSEKFREIHKCAKNYLEKWGCMYPNPIATTPATRELVDCMEDFLKTDCTFLDILRELKEYGKRDPLWQTLVGHIQQEQRYMYRLIETLLMQICR